MLQLPSLNKLITSLVNFLLSSSEGEDSASFEFSLALQCIREYWMIVTDYLNQKGMCLLLFVLLSMVDFEVVLSQFFSLINNSKRIPISERSSFLSLLAPFKSSFPHETEIGIQSNGHQLVKYINSLPHLSLLDF